MDISYYDITKTVTNKDNNTTTGWNNSTITSLGDYLEAIGSLGNIAKIYYFGAAGGTEVSFAFPHNSYNKIWVIYTTHGATPSVNTLWIIHPNHVSGNCFRLAISGSTTTGVTMSLSNPNTANCRLKVKSTGGTAGVYGLTYGII